MLLLVAIGPDSRREERDLDREFAEEAPALFGALLDGLVSGLRNLTTVEITDKPRMADFALWAEACTLAYWPAGTFMQAYRENMATAVDVVIEASAVGDAVRHFMSGRVKWEGTASELLRLLTPLVPEALARERSWPKSARALSGKLRRAAPPLRKVGIDVTFLREGHDRERTIVITTHSKVVANFASAPSAEMEKSEKHSNGKGLDADANADGMRTQPSDADANADGADGMRTQTEDGPSADNHRKNNGFSQNADVADGADANSATSLPSADSVPSDYDAVLEERAAQGRPTNGFRPPRGNGWHLAGDRPRDRRGPSCGSRKCGRPRSARRAMTCSTFSIQGGGDDHARIS